MLMKLGVEIHPCQGINCSNICIKCVYRETSDAQKADCMERNTS